jgi:outer membrane protein assembly factor BamB
MKRLLTVIAMSVALTGIAHAQRGGVDWMTESADSQRSSWIRSDGKISKERMEKADPKDGFQFLWKMKLKNAPRQMNSLMPPATLDRLIGYRGFRMLGFFGGSSDSIFTIDTDLGRMEWEKRLKTTTPATPGTLACPGGMTTGVVRPTLATIPPSPTGPAGPGRNSPAKSAVGDPGKGAVTLANVRPSPPPGPNPMLVQPTRVNPANPPGGQLGAGPFLVYALAGDGMLHSLHLSNGADYEPPTKFIPPGANAQGLIVIDQVAYVATTGGCGGAANGVWALDLLTKQVSTWKGEVVGTAGPTFGGDGTVYVATGAGGESPNAIVALESKTLKLKSTYSAGGQAFTSTPVVFEHKGRTLLAAATGDGRIHLLDGKDLSKAVAASPAAGRDFAPGALASWQDRTGARWILAPVVGALPAGFTAANGAVTKGAVVAWKVEDRGGALSLRPGWASRDLVSPLTPTIINGVVFVTSSGEFRSNDSKVTAAMRAARSSRAVVYALDALTGKELWNSGATIASFARGGAIAGGMGQIYVTTHDGTVYTFGFPMEH